MELASVRPETLQVKAHFAKLWATKLNSLEIKLKEQPRKELVRFLAAITEGSFGLAICISIFISKWA